MSLDPRTWSLFAKGENPKETSDELPIDSIVWAEDSVFWSGANGTKYNPDALISKKGHAIYRKMMLDEQVKAVVRFKRDAITSRDYFFEANIDELGEEEAKRRVLICEEYLTQMKGSFLDSINGMMSSMYQGFSITEKVFKQIEVDGLTYWGISYLRLKPYDTFEFQVDDFGGILKLIQTLNGKESEIDLSRVIHHLNNPEYDEHYGQSELREAYRAWFHKDMTYRFYGMWLERHASGFKVVTPKDGKTLTPGSNEYTQIQAALSKTVNGAAMILPGTVELEVHFPTNNVAFKEAIVEDNLAIARALLVPNLMGITPSGQTGSFSQSDTQLDAFFWTLDADAARLEDTINEQLFSELGEINFGDEYWPRFRFKDASDKKKMATISTWKELVTAKAVTASDTDEAHIREQLDFPEVGEKINEPVVEPNGADSDDEDDDKSNASKGKNGKKKDEDLPDESLRGKLAKIKMSRAEKRVDFAVIERSSLGLEAEHSDAVASHLTSMVQYSIGELKTIAPKSWVDELNKVAFTTRQKTKMNKLVDKALKEGWALGQKHAQIELDKAKGAAFSLSNIDKGRINLISEQYFKTSSFKAAGKLTDDAMAKIERIILNGAKYDKTVKEVEEEIYAQFASDGMITEEAAKQALGEAMRGIANPQARINTMIRTNLFEAINEARFSYFTDPILDGFVQALEYSAVMDSRTTEICSHLDGTTHASHSDLWNAYRPPNHFNCRSILTAVTEDDEWKESKDPTLKPDKGFD